MADNLAIVHNRDIRGSNRFGLAGVRIRRHKRQANFLDIGVKRICRLLLRSRRQQRHPRNHRQYKQAAQCCHSVAVAIHHSLQPTQRIPEAALVSRGDSISSRFSDHVSRAIDTKW